SSPEPQIAQEAAMGWQAACSPGGPAARRLTSVAILDFPTAISVIRSCVLTSYACDRPGIRVATKHTARSIFMAGDLEDIREPIHIHCARHSPRCRQACQDCVARPPARTGARVRR